MKKRIGILGGGQLGRMLTQAAISMGFEVTVLDPTPDFKSPAALVGAKQIIGSFTNPQLIEQLANEVDFLTWEIEHIDAEILKTLTMRGTKINPSPESLSLIKDKFTQKAFLKSIDVPVPDFKKVENPEDILNAAKIFGFPLLLKTRFGGYDGRGNAVIHDFSEVANAVTKLGGNNLYVEQFVPFEKELAVIAARDMQGNIAIYPVVETIQQNNICHMVIAPAQINTEAEMQATTIAKKVLDNFDGAGVYGIEMFLTKDGKVLLNEIAPRVHNSGHFTLGGAKTSQFEQHIRAITGMPLGDTSLVQPIAVMINILGDRQGVADTKGINDVIALGGVDVQIYGKAETKPERKMGHITVIHDKVEEAIRIAQQARKLIYI